MQVQFMPIKIRNIGEINCVDYFEISQKISGLFTCKECFCKNLLYACTFSRKLAPIFVKKGLVKWIELLRGYGVLC